MLLCRLLYSYFEFISKKIYYTLCFNNKYNKSLIELIFFIILLKYIVVFKLQLKAIKSIVSL